MNVSSIQSCNSSSQNFKGRVTVVDLKTKVTKEFKIKKEADRVLYNTFMTIQNKKFHKENVKKYLDALYKVTSDSFVKDLHLPEKIISDDSLFSKSSFSTFVTINRYTSLITDDFHIMHDLNVVF